MFHSHSHTKRLEAEVVVITSVDVCLDPKDAFTVFCKNVKNKNEADAWFASVNEDLEPLISAGVEVSVLTYVTEVSSV